MCRLFSHYPITAEELMNTLVEFYNLSVVALYIQTRSINCHLPLSLLSLRFLAQQDFHFCFDSSYPLYIP